MAPSASTLIVIGIIVVLMGGLIILGIMTWPSSTPVPGDGYMYLESYTFSVGNGLQVFFDTSPTEWPYTRTNSQVSITYMYSIPVTTVSQPSLPILLTLPSNATSLSGYLTMSSRALPSGQIAIHPVQYGPNTVALVYEPSGQYATGAELVGMAWQLIFSVVYTIAP